MSIERLLGELRSEIAEQRADIAKLSGALASQKDWAQPILYTKKVAAKKLSVSVGKLQQMIDAGLILVTWLDEKRKSARIHISEIQRISRPPAPKTAARGGGRKKKATALRTPAEEAALVRARTRRR